MKIFFFIGFLCFVLQTNAVLLDPYNFYSRLNLTGATGPQSAVFGPLRLGPFAPVEDGRVLKYNGNEFVDFATLFQNRPKEACDGTTDKNLGRTCGRALGLTYAPFTGNFYVVNAYGGLYLIRPNGGVATRLAPNATVLTNTFLNGVDYDGTRNVLYIISPSTTVTYRNLIDGIPFPVADVTGRLFKYNIRSREVTTLLDNLPGPSGLAVCPDGTCVLIASGSTNQILKYFLIGPRAGTTESLLNVSGIPLSIRRAATPGHLWVGVNVVVSGVRRPFGYKFSQSGKVMLIKNFTKEYPNAQVNTVQEYIDLSGAKLLIGSRSAYHVGIYKTVP